MKQKSVCNKNLSQSKLKILNAPDNKKGMCSKSVKWHQVQKGENAIGLSSALRVDQVPD